MKNKLHMPETIWKLTLNENNTVTIPEWWLGEKRKYGLNPRFTWGSYMCLRVHRWLSHYRYNMKELKDIPQSTERETQQQGKVWKHVRTWYNMQTLNQNQNELYFQVCLNIRGICYSDRRSTVQQNDSNSTGHRQQKNNIPIGNVQNDTNTIYNTDNYVCTGMTCKFENKIKKYVWWINNSVVCSMFNVKCSWD